LQEHLIVWLAKASTYRLKTLLAAGAKISGWKFYGNRRNFGVLGRERKWRSTAIDISRRNIAPGSEAGGELNFRSKIRNKIIAQRREVSAILIVRSGVDEKQGFTRHNPPGAKTMETPTPRSMCRLTPFAHKGSQRRGTAAI